jgi:hypothetical protein
MTDKTQTDSDWAIFYLEMHGVHFALGDWVLTQRQLGRSIADVREMLRAATAIAETYR